MQKSLLIFLLVLVLSSCKSTTDRQWVVVNDSSTEIIVQLDGEMDSYSSETVIPSGQQETIGLESGESGEPAGNPADKITDMLVFNSTDSVDKDFRLESNWSIREEPGSGSSTTFIFSFELADDDF